jgi:hypothetical protein
MERRDHVLTWGYMRDLMLPVDLERLNVIISSGVALFLVLVPWWPRQESGWPKFCLLGHLTWGCICTCQLYA